MAPIKPFRFHLAKVSKAHNKLVEELLEFLPSVGVKDAFHLAIRKALQQYLSDIRYYLAAIEPKSFHDFYSNLPNPASVAVLGMEPFKEKAFVEIDPALSNVIIAKLLGGKGDDLQELRPMTETEQGVVEFLILKLLSQIHKLCGDKAKLHFRLEQMILEPARLRMSYKDDFPMVCLKVHVALLNVSGFVNIFLPHPWVLEGFLKDIPGGRKTLVQKELRENMKSYGHLPVELWSSLGDVSVVWSDLKNLEAGDVVLFDETNISKRKGEWMGEVELHVGKGESGGFTALWEGFKEGGLCRLTGMLRGGKIHG
ncbi:MAG: hypothetical protein Q7T03_05825 [Deltaproteobacteria bacterium]|nr:hypothetical protein [Deltaproteobacteria bacterium]